MNAATGEPASNWELVASVPAAQTGLGLCATSVWCTDPAKDGSAATTVPANSTLQHYEARCICEDRWRGSACQHEDQCYKHCLNGCTCWELAEDRVQCVCPPRFYGSRCHIPVQSQDSAHVHEVDNQAITTMTVTIVSVSIVAVVLMAGIIYLIVVMTSF